VANNINKLKLQSEEFVVNRRARDSFQKMAKNIISK